MKTVDCFKLARVFFAMFCDKGVMYLRSTLPWESFIFSYIKDSNWYIRKQFKSRSVKLS